MTTMPTTGFGLDGHVCVVTGAGGGIGRGIALALAAEGAQVAILDRNEDGANETLALVEQSGGRGLAICCDVTDHLSIKAAEAAITEKLDEIQVLVNNAGTIRPGALESIGMEEWNAIVALNLTAYLACSQVFGRAMRKNRYGALVHISSISSDFVTPFCGAYSVTKAGVTMLARQLAVEWGPMGIRSNVVLPGFIYTPMVKAMYDTPGVSERRAAAVPCGRIGTPDDIGQAVVFLASDRAGYVNGAELLVDGGLTNNVMSLVPRTGYEKSNT
jgi:NAD(P)-dependent dehydrogenase (short-subunit alcohol dehydrogenase family)